MLCPSSMAQLIEAEAVQFGAGGGGVGGSIAVPELWVCFVLLSGFRLPSHSWKLCTAQLCP